MAVKGETLCDIVKNFKDFESVGGEYTGYLESGYDYADFISGLRRLGYSFAVRSSRLLNKLDSTRILYSMVQGDIKIPFFGSPFQVTKTYDMECSQGPNYKRKWTETAQYHRTNYEGRKMRKRPPSQRIGCPCKLYVKCIRIFLDYRVDEVKKGGLRQYLVMKSLKRDLKNPDNEVRTTERFYIAVSKENAHTHPIISPSQRRKIKGRKSIGISIMNHDMVDCIHFEGNEEVVSADVEPVIGGKNHRISVDLGNEELHIETMVQCSEDLGNCPDGMEQNKEGIHQSPRRDVSYRYSISKDSGTHPLKEHAVLLSEHQWALNDVLYLDVGEVVADPNLTADADMTVASECDGESLRRARETLRERLIHLFDLSESVQDETRMNNAAQRVEDVIAYLSNGSSHCEDRLIMFAAQSTRPSSINSQTQPKSSRCVGKSSEYTCEVVNEWQGETEYKLDGAKELNLKHNRQCKD